MLVHLAGPNDGRAEFGRMIDGIRVELVLKANGPKLGIELAAKPGHIHLVQAATRVDLQPRLVGPKTELECPIGGSQNGHWILWGKFAFY
jgi:hypothetical protein